MRNRKIFILLTPLSIPYILTLVLLIRNILQEDAFTHHCDLKRTPIEAAPLGYRIHSYFHLLSFKLEI